MQSNKSKFNFRKRFVQLALVLVLILILGFLFFYTWVSEYNQILRRPYILKGNIFLMIVYMIVEYIFMLFFDCNNISDNRTANIIFSETLASISSNILVYFVMIIPAAALGLMPFTPIIILTLKDILVIILWSYIVHIVFTKVFPPEAMLLISSENSIDKEICKFLRRKDLYDIKDSIPYKNNLEQVYNLCDKYDSIIIGDISSEARNDIIKYCFYDSKSIYVIPKLSDILIKHSDDIFTCDMPIYFSSNFGLSAENIIFKRLTDILVSIFVIFLFLPIWLVIALLIKIEDGGPIFFIQKRVTKDDKLFNIIKFRSMKVNSNDINVLPTINDDPRVTKIGKFIRKLHIDEVPQFINVLIGDMSVVGPRPERKEHYELYSNEIKEFNYRTKVKAGITGLAQIYGKYNTSAIDKLKLDLIYIKRYSLMFDFELIFRTLKVLVIPDNTDGFDVETQKFIKNNAKQ